MRIGVKADLFAVWNHVCLLYGILVVKMLNPETPRTFSRLLFAVLCHYLRVL